MKRAAAQHVVDHDLQRPRLRQLEEADQQHLPDGAEEEPPVGDEAPEDLPEEADGAPHRSLLLGGLGGRILRTAAERPERDP